MPRTRCTATKRDGTPCRSFAVADGWCQAHHPERTEAHREATRRGGESRSATRRAARAWAMTGEQIRQDDLPAILRACLLDVRLGKIEPGVAGAIANLARVSVQLTADLELDARLQRLEQAAGIVRPSPIHRVK